MTKEEIIRMAREARVTEVISLSELRLNALERFAALVAAAERNSWPAEMEAMERQVNILTDALAQAKAEERESCAEVCEELRTPDYLSMSEGAAWDTGTLMCADAIRARGQA